MGKATGFLEYGRKTADYRAVEERLKDYREITQPMAETELRAQASRCMDCGVAFCHAIGCPVSNLVPEFNDALYHGRWEEALERLELTNNLPEITGRVCPAPCEAACTLSINSSPVTIRQMELAIVEYGFNNNLIIPRPPSKESDRRVAVIGSGPAGLTSAQQLRRKGHKVTVFEKAIKPGGILRYGIPDFKLDKSVIDRRLDQLRLEGIKFETGVAAGDDISVRYLRNKFDAIVITSGASQPRDLDVPGRELENIVFAMDYLSLSNKVISGELSEKDMFSAKGKVVLVIGGGDTGSDCVGTANRQGAKKVYQFEILPKPPTWENPWNPQWPNYPSILRSSSSHVEGCERRWSVLTKGFQGAYDAVSEVICAEVDWVKDEQGSPSKMIELPDTEFLLKSDMVILAIGFVHTEHSRLLTDFELELDSRRNIKIDDGFMTSVEGVFAAGDAVSGPSLVVKAINQARTMSENVDRYLRE